MNAKTLLTILAGASILAVSAGFAQPIPQQGANQGTVEYIDEPTISEEEIQQKYFEKLYGNVKERVPLRPIDKEALKMNSNWNQAKSVHPHIGNANGAVVYTFGTVVPRVMCRPLRVTDIQLQPGEEITGTPTIGDSVNWAITPSSSGSGDALTVHVLVKPTMPDIATNLIIHTNRRTYVFDLVSTKKQHTPVVAFAYPDWEADQKWKAFMSRVSNSASSRNSLPSGRDPRVPAMLNRNYHVRGDKTLPWYPIDVADDGLKTYITFSDKIEADEFPVFFILRKKKKILVNYRPAGNAMIIDRIFNNGVLSVGAGLAAKNVYILRNAKDAPVPMKEESHVELTHKLRQLEANENAYGGN